VHCNSRGEVYCSSSGGFHFHRIAEAGRMSSSASFFSSSRPHIPIHVTIAGPHQHVFQHQPYSPSLDGQTPLASQLMLVDHSTPPLSPSASALVPFLVHGAPTSFTGRKRQRTKASSTFHVEIDHALHSLTPSLTLSGGFFSFCFLQLYWLFWHSPTKPSPANYFRH